MSNISMVCDAHKFLVGIIKLCLETKEMLSMSNQQLQDLNAIIEENSDFEDVDWELSLASWSPSRGWAWVDGEDISMPVILSKCKGPVCNRLKESLPNNSLGEVTAIYCYIKHILCIDGEADGIYANLGKGLDLSDDRIVLELYKFPESDEPTRIDIDFAELDRKRAALIAAFPDIDASYYSQAY